jgi:hypothetical protein
MEDNVFYEERLSSGRTQALFWGLTALFSLLLAWRIAAGSLDLLGEAFLFLALLFLFYSLNYRVLIIRLAREGLKLQFGLFKWTIPLENIETSSRDDNMPVLAKYGGAGIHFMFVRGRYRVSFNFLEHHRVLIALRHPRIVRDVSFSTQRPDDVIHHLDVALRGHSAA